jgi:hypothetical protein
MDYRKHFTSVPFLFISALLFMGCGKDSLESKPDERNYFPLKVGDYRIYHVTETTITPFNIEHTLEYELKTVVTDSFKNSEGDYSYIISRLKRATAVDTWTSFDTWSARVNSREVVMNEGNVPYVKLTFPVVEGREWNGNAYNGEESIEFCEGDSFTSCDLYSFGEIGASIEPSPGVQFDNCIEVIENNSLDVIVQKDVRRSVYAFGVGLVEREIVILKYCTADDCLGDQLVQDGLIYSQKLIDHGNE